MARITLDENITQVIDQMGLDYVSIVSGVLDQTMAEGVNFGRSLGAKRQQGARIRTSRGGRPYYFYSNSLPSRKAHPGGWADVTGNLSNRYGFDQAAAQGGEIVGTLFNTAQYAPLLERNRRKRGGIYWVLAGLNPDDKLDEFKFDEKFSRNLDALLEL